MMMRQFKVDRTKVMASADDTNAFISPGNAADSRKDERNNPKTNLHQSPVSDKCRRKCHPEDNHYNIIILDHYEQAGLGDRLFVFRRLASLAGYLCARLYVPPPYTMVGQR